MGDVEAEWESSSWVVPFSNKQVARAAASRGVGLFGLGTSKGAVRLRVVRRVWSTE